MPIKWSQESFEQLATPFNSWTEFLAKYPSGQAAASRGKFDPWIIFLKGGGKVQSAVMVDLCDPEYHYRDMMRQYDAAGLKGDHCEQLARKYAEDSAKHYRQQAAWQARQIAKRDNLTDDELIKKLNSCVAYLSMQPETFAPYLELVKKRGIDLSRLHQNFLVLL